MLFCSTPFASSNVVLAASQCFSHRLAAPVLQTSARCDRDGRPLGLRMAGPPHHGMGGTIYGSRAVLKALQAFAICLKNRMAAPTWQHAL
jgi:hypothetical protein